ncbi:MAG: alpha/beta hydrolase [bacterium]|nr:alpha/beta hydrolase [bacterium]
MPQQILIIRGGDAHKTNEDYLDFLRTRNFEKEDLVGRKKWASILQKDLGSNYEVLLPGMPCSCNAKYINWKIWFERFFPFLRDNIILIGSSLGATFLAKYLSENTLPVKIKVVFMLAGPYDSEYLGDFSLPESLEKFSTQCPKIFLYHSKDDPIVPFTELEKYSKALPKAEKVIFKDKGHFALKEFPEFVEKLKSIK